MNILVACEESQRVCLAFRANGHNAFSCDLQPCSGGVPKYHYLGSVFDILDGGLFSAEDGSINAIDRWDMLIGFPPCYRLSNLFMCNVPKRPLTERELQFLRERDEAVQFFLRLWLAPIKYIALENPRGYINSNVLLPSQIIQPYFFGDPYRKLTCLWLKGLPQLRPTKIVDPHSSWVQPKVKSQRKDLEFIAKDSKIRSKTFNGVAHAMADQWSNPLIFDEQLSLF